MHFCLTEVMNSFPICLLSFLKVILLSLRAGGVGLNLIGGNHLFLIDQHW